MIRKAVKAKSIVDKGFKTKANTLCKRIREIRPFQAISVANFPEEKSPKNSNLLYSKDLDGIFV